MIFHHDVMIISVQTDKMAILFLKQLIITFLKYTVSKTALIFLVKKMCRSILWCLHFIVKMSGLLHVLYVLYAGFWGYIFLYGCIFITKCKL